MNTQQIPYGYCHCGCGQKTPLATRTRGSKGTTKGEPVHFLGGHANRKYRHIGSPNPAGLCMCGCGEKTTIAIQSSKAHGTINGEPRRFVTGHARRRPLAERFWNKVDKRTKNECWPWMAGSDHHGRGLISTGINVNGTTRHVVATRAGWELVFGPIPDGMNVLHKCDNPSCCNPDHWFLGTQADNIHDMLAKGRGQHQKKR